MVDNSRPAHIRDIHIEAWLPGENTLLLRGELGDERPQGIGAQSGRNEKIHGIGITIELSLPALRIESIEVDMPTVPQPECREVREGAKKLVGETVASGFSKKVLETLPRTETCPHIVTLILQMAPVAIQGSYVYFFDQASNAIKSGELNLDKFTELTREQWKNSCYVAAEDGPGLKKMEKHGMRFPLCEVAGMLGRSPEELIEEARKGRFPAKEEDGKWLVWWKDLKDWMPSGKR